jgi:hypothetical protein
MIHSVPLKVLFLSGPCSLPKAGRENTASSHSENTSSPENREQTSYAGKLPGLIPADGAMTCVYGLKVITFSEQIRKKKPCFPY